MSVHPLDLILLYQLFKGPLSKKSLSDDLVVHLFLLKPGEFVLTTFLSYFV